MMCHPFKKISSVLCAVLCVLTLGACRQSIYAGRPFVPNQRSTALPTEPKTTRAAEMISLETPLRCGVRNDEKNMMTVIPFKQTAFSLTVAETGDKLPSFAVLDFSVENKTAEQIFYELLKDYGTKVIGIDGPFPELSVDGLRGESNDVADMIAQGADVYYRYHAKSNTLYVSRNVQWHLQVPAAREVILAVLDSLRGSGFHDLTVNWEDNVITFTGDKDTENKINKLISLFDTEPQLIAFDVQVFRTRPFTATHEIIWQKMLKTFGSAAVKQTLRGVLGRALITGYEVNASTLSEFLKSQATVTTVSEGMFIAANGWRSRFDVGRCNRMALPESQLSVMAQSEIKNSRLSAVITLDSDKGEITAFNNIRLQLGNSILLIGIPSSSFSPSLKEHETVVLLTPRVIHLVKEY